MLYTLSTTFLEQILDSRFLFVATSGIKKSNFNDGFRLKTCNNLSSKICCQNAMDVALINVTNVQLLYN